MPDESAAEAIVAPLSAIVGSGGLLLSDADTAKYTTDWRRRFHGDVACVVRPRSVDEVSAILGLCSARNVPVVPQGGNTGLRGAATPSRASGAVLVSLERMNRVRGIDLAAAAITVDGGCTLQAIQQAAVDVDRLFPLAIGSQGSCQIGGNIATNAGGLTVMRYGTVRDLLLGIEVVLPDGRVMNTLRALRKTSAGYDLKHLFVSSEGTLGIITGAVLKLFPRPRTVVTAWVALDRLEAAIDLLSLLRERFQERVSSYEVISRGQLDLVFKHCANTRDPTGGGYPWAALLELSDGVADSGLQDEVEATLAGAMETGVARDIVVATSAQQAKTLWYLREGLSAANVAEGRLVSHDTSVPIGALPAFVERANQRVLAAYPEAMAVSAGHVGDGNIHVGYMFQHGRFPTSEEYERVAAHINDIVFDVTRGLDGGFCAEHGIGIPYREPLARFADPVELEVMRALKKALDPKGIMNPGKVFL